MKKHVLLVPAALLLAACGGGDNTTGSRQLSAPVQSDTTIQGDVRTSASLLPVGEIRVSVRGSDVSTTVDAASQYRIDLPASDDDRTVIVDFRGDNIVEQSLSVFVPAQIESVEADVDVGTRTAPVAFNLDVGGELKNAGSSTRTSVTVPPNAFELPDGTIATGDAFVSITEIDIQDYAGNSAWVPDMIGTRVNSTEEVAITSFGMSDFHFYQGDQVLQLRAGVEATIKMDLLEPYTITNDNGVPLPAQAGDVMPLWHYDPQDMIWEEEGFAVVSADVGSSSGYSAAGKVSHFSTWNIDVWTPQIPAEVNLYFEDENGVIIEGSNTWIKSYHVTAKTVRPSWHGESAWTNRRNLTPTDRWITVMANGPDRQHLIDTVPYVTGWVEMDISVDSIVLDDAYLPGMGMNFQLPVSGRKVFRSYDGDHSITLSLPVN
ncbi:MAG: hypothetical protein AAGA11_07905 [Pseudomonadota bacterium]